MSSGSSAASTPPPSTTGTAASVRPSRCSAVRAKATISCGLPRDVRERGRLPGAGRGEQQRGEPGDAALRDAAEVQPLDHLHHRGDAERVGDEALEHRARGRGRPRPGRRATAPASRAGRRRPSRRRWRRAPGSAPSRPSAARADRVDAGAADDRDRVGAVGARLEQREQVVVEHDSGLRQRGRPCRASRSPRGRPRAPPAGRGPRGRAPSGRAGAGPPPRAPRSTRSSTRPTDAASPVTCGFEPVPRACASTRPSGARATTSVFEPPPSTAIASSCGSLTSPTRGGARSPRAAGP